METSIRKWSQLQNIKVNVPSAGKTVGIVEDFYYKSESSGVDALLVRTRLGDALNLPVSKIQKIEGDAVVIESEQMLGRRLSPYPLGSSLIGSEVQDEKGNEIGKVNEILLNIEPVIATRVAGFEMGSNGHGRGKTFSSDAVTRYENHQFTLQDQFARKLK